VPTSPVAVFDVDAGLLEALETAFGPPIDSYLRGWQVWIEPMDPDADDAVELEYRLHPPAGFGMPNGLNHHDLWDEVITQVADGAPTFALGAEQCDLPDIWVLLEVFPAFGDEMTSAEVAAAAEAALGRPARAHGDVDHERLGGRFKREGHDADLPAALLAALEPR
jgi:hypothetical protein